MSQTLYVILLIMCWRLEYFLMIGKSQKYILFLSLMKEIYSKQLSTDFYSTCHFENYRKGHALSAVRVFSSR